MRHSTEGRQKRKVLFCCAILGALCSTPTMGAELNVYVPGAVRPAVVSTAKSFEQATGHRVSFTFGTGGGIHQQVASGAPADVTVLPRKAVAELEQKGLVRSMEEVGRLGVGVGIKAGAARPNIGTPDDLRAALLAAGSVAYADPAKGGTAGVYFASVVLPRLGIAEAVQRKSVLGAVGREAVDYVVNGEAELVVVQASEIVAVLGAELVGPLPREIQQETPYAAVVLTSGKFPEAALAYVRHLVSPSGKAAFAAAGFTTDAGR